MKTLILSLYLFSISIILQAGESVVPLQKGVRIPSDDLLYEGKVLTSREAQSLSNTKQIDLSLLQPKPNQIWQSEKTLLNDQEVISLEEQSTLTFEGSLTSNTGLYRFNAIELNGSKIYTIHLDKTLHSLLLRKNILRNLGYNIPAIKYLKKVTIEFKTLEDREQFLKKDIPENTLGAAERWVKNINGLSLDLYDVAVTEPSENDFYNIAMGVPTQTLNSRTLRSLLIPYSILDLFESINQFSWVDGKIDNNAVILSHFTGNEFSTTLEDAQWMLRKFNLLSRSDIESSVRLSFFPEDVGAVVVEKIISRRNSLNKLFSEKAQDLPFNQKITIAEVVKSGKVIQKEYPGYASRFAYGDADSPFAQLQYYLYSKIQSNVIDNLIAKFNTNLVGYDLSKIRSDFFKKQFSDGLNHFLQTGEINPIGISTWSTPSFNAQLIFSRDIVLGNYLGTDNLVQLADTFGGSIDLGLYMGVEGFGNNLSSGVKASTALVRTFSHVKPVKSLKLSLKEPYKNMFVNLLKSTLKEQYFSLSELQNATDSKDEKAKKVQNILKEINKYLDTGESLIMTDRLMPSAEVKLNFATGLIGAGVGASVGVTTVKRIQFYKKSAKVLQIYDDKGFVEDINLSFQLNEYIPILKVTGKYNRGNYNLKSYMVNLSSDLDENPNLYSNSLGVYNILKDKNFELLNTTTTPVKMLAEFKDRSLAFSLFFWKLKAVKGKTYYNLEAKDGLNGSYFSLNKDFLNGINTESFSKQIANYYLAEQTAGDVALSVDGEANPGDSFFGRSTTKSIRFEAALTSEKKFERKFLSLSDSKMGWALKPQKLIMMMKAVNDKFQTQLFDTTQVDFEKLRLFKIGYHLNLYDKGIERLNNIKLSEIEAIETRYKVERKCFGNQTNNETAQCGDLKMIKWNLKKCQKTQLDEDLASCDVELVEQLFADLNFEDFKTIIGLNNLYVFATMDGFRQNSEILNDTIYSNTIGKIGSKEWSGPLDVVRELLGLSNGEFSGSWMRESI